MAKDIRRVGDKMLDMVTGEVKEVVSIDPVVFSDGTKMRNPDCYKFLGNDNPFPVPRAITINGSELIIDGKIIETGRFRCNRVLHVYEGSLVLEALAKDQLHKILINYNVEHDTFHVISEHAADKLDVLYENGNIWAVRTTRTDKVEDIDEDDNPADKFPVYENVLVLKDGEVLETLSSDWMFGDVAVVQKDEDNETETLVFVSEKKRNEYGEPQDAGGESRITRVTVSEPLEPEDENNPEEYGVETRTDIFRGGTVRKISLVPNGKFAPGLFAIGKSSILYSGERKRWADGADVADTAMSYPHLIRCDVDGNTTTFMLANDQYETVRIRTESTSDRGLVSTIER